MSFWTGFAGGIQAGARLREGFDERGGLAGIFGSGAETQAADKPMSDFSAAASEQGTPAAPASGEWPADLGAAARAIRTIESGSAEGDYTALGRVTRTGDRAYGAYQVMGANVPAWTEQHFGQRLTPQQFLNNPAAQDAVFRGEFGRYMSRYGAEGASRAWFAGEGGMNRMRSQDINGTSVSGYNSRFGQLYSGFLSGGQRSAATGGRNRTFTTDGEIEPIRVMPGEIEIPSLFDNQVRPDAGQQIRESGEIEQLAASARRPAAPGLAVTEPAARPRALRAGEVDSATDPQMREGQFDPPAPVRIENANIQPSAAAAGGVSRGGAAAVAASPSMPALGPGETGPVSSPEVVYRDDSPPTPIRRENADLEARAYARGGVGDGPGGRAATSAVREAPGLGIQARAVAPRALAAGEVDSATDPQMAASPTATGTATGYATGAAGGRASASADVPSAPTSAPVPQPRPAQEAAAPAAAPAAASRPAAATPAAAPAPAPRPAPAAAPAAPAGRGNLSERDTLMLLRDPSSLAPGEEERLRASLPQNTMRMPDLMSLFRGRSSTAPTRERSAERVRPSPAPRPSPAAAAPATTGSVAPAPIRVEPTPRAPVGPSGNVQEGDQPPAPAAAPAAPAAAPAQRAPDPVPYPEPRNDQERFANGRAAALAALDRGEPPEQVAQGLQAAGVPVEEWPQSLRPVQTAARRGPVYDARGQLLPSQGGLSGSASAQAMRTGRAPGIVMR